MIRSKQTSSRTEAVGLHRTVTSSSPTPRARSCPLGTSLWPRFQKQMFFELNRQVGIVSRYGPKLRSVDVVQDLVGSAFQAAKLNGATPMLGIKSVVQSLILADHMSLGHVKANVVELSEILTLRKHFFAIDAKPGFEFLLARRSQIRLASFPR